MDDRMRVYLSGGLRSGWQTRVKEAVPALNYIDPRNHGLEHDPAQYTLWDLIKVEQSDIIFAYMEADNPSGIGLSAEVGYGRALGKKIIFVDEKQDRYFAFIRELADVVVSNLAEGIRFLCALQEQK